MSEATILALVFKGLLNNGPIGIMLCIALWDNWKMKKKLFEMIEHNTVALTQTTDVMINVKDELKELKTVSSRRTDFGNDKAAMRAARRLNGAAKHYHKMLDAVDSITKAKKRKPGR